MPLADKIWEVYNGVPTVIEYWVFMENLKMKLSLKSTGTWIKMVFPEFSVKSALIIPAQRVAVGI